MGGHPDDVELGCGGTLARHVDAGDLVSILVLSAGALSRDGASTRDATTLYHQAMAAGRTLGASVAMLNFPDQRFDSVDLLTITKAVEDAILAVRPSQVYTHHYGDLNADHRITHRAVVTACRPVNGCSVRRVDTFEVPSSSEWGSGFLPTTFVDVAGGALKRKLASLAHYTGELRPAPHPRSLESIEALARWRGASAGLEAAEAFALVREIR